jgi:uncharacterized protein (DUF3820 family)
MTEKNDNIVPFGKYKGRLVEELLADDPQYLEWLSSQDWFRVKYVSLHQTIINRGAEPEETPDHNALQVLFLDDEFCLQFIRALDPRFRSVAFVSVSDKTEAKAQLATAQWNLGACSSQIEKYKQEIRDLNGDADRESEWDEIKEKQHQKIVELWAKLDVEIKNEADLREEFERVKKQYDKMTVFDVEREFEVGGVDVTLTISYCMQHLMIEIKPVVSDDYPKVLRQMLSQDRRYHRTSRVLFLERYTGTGATREQFIKTFGSAGIRVIFRNEVEPESQ